METKGSAILGLSLCMHQPQVLGSTDYFRLCLIVGLVLFVARLFVDFVGIADRRSSTCRTWGRPRYQHCLAKYHDRRVLGARGFDICQTRKTGTVPERLMCILFEGKGVGALQEHGRLLQWALS